MPILKPVSSIKRINLQAMVPALLVLVVSFGPWVSVHAQEISAGTPTVIAPAPAPAEPAPAPAAPETPAPLEPAPVPPAPVETFSVVEEVVPPTEVVPGAPAEPAPAVDEPVEEAVPPTNVPVAPVETPTEAAIIPADPSGESEDDPAETSGTDPGSETIGTPETPVQTVVATESPTPAPTTAATPTPSPTVVPSPTPEPTPVITWSQPEPVTCVQHAGDPQSLALGDTAAWRCEVSITADVTGQTPEDLHVIWEIGASYAGDDVRLSLPSGSAGSVLVPDSNPGGTSEPVTYRTDWADGQTLTFDVTVTRTSCVVGEAQLTIHSDVNVKSADESLQIARSGELPLATRLVSVASSNQDALVISMQPVDFGSLQWDGKSWGTAYATSTVTVSNESPCSTSQSHLIKVEVNASNPGMTPVISSVSMPGSVLTAVAKSDEKAATVGVASVPAGFEGTAEVRVEFVLTPAPDVDPGSHTFNFQAAVVPAP